MTDADRQEARAHGNEYRYVVNRLKATFAAGWTAQAEQIESLRAELTEARQEIERLKAERHQHTCRTCPEEDPF